MKYKNLSFVLLLIFISFFTTIFPQEDEKIAPASARTSGKAQAFGKQLYIAPAKGFAYRFTGQTTFETIYDTRQFQGFLQDTVVFFPFPVTLDPRRLDIADKDQLTFFALSTSGKTLFVGPKIWGANTSGRIDFSFGGINDSTVWLSRLSNAYINFIWRRTTELRFGFYYHPMALAKVYPTTVSGNEGIGYDPNARAPIVRIRHNTGNWKFVAAIAKRFNLLEAKWAVLPDLFFQANFYRNENMYGAGVCYRADVPRIETDFGFKTTEQLNSFYAFAFARIIKHPFLIKTRVSYLENGIPFGTIGGHAVSFRNSITDERRLVPLRTVTFWSDMLYKGSKTLEPGLFIGISKAIGARSKIIKCYQDEDGNDVSLLTGLTNVSYMFTFTPRLRAVFKNMILGFELEYARAAFSRSTTEQGWQDDLDDYGRISNEKAVGNIALIFTATYTF